MQKTFPDIRFLKPLTKWCDPAAAGYQKPVPGNGYLFYIGMIDGMMALERDAEEDTYGHYEERTELLIDVVGRMAKAHRMDAAEACRMYYGTKIAATVAEDSTGYYKKSAEEIFEAAEKE